MLTVYTAINFALRSCGATSERTATDRDLIESWVSRRVGRPVSFVQGCVDDMIRQGQVALVESTRVYLKGAW